MLHLNIINNLFGQSTTTQYLSVAMQMHLKSLPRISEKTDRLRIVPLKLKYYKQRRSLH